MQAALLSILSKCYTSEILIGMGEEERPVLQVGGTVFEFDGTDSVSVNENLCFQSGPVQTAGPLFDPLALLPPGTVLTSLQQYGAHLRLNWNHES